jgi:hypothetical protein
MTESSLYPVISLEGEKNPNIRVNLTDDVAAVRPI